MGIEGRESLGTFERVMPVYGAIAFLGILAAGLLPLRTILPRCRFLEWTGLPCPGCGATRVADALAHGRIPDAFAAGPFLAASAVVFALLTAAALLALILGRPLPAVRMSRRETLAARLAFGLALLLNWAYLIAGARS